MKPDIPGNIERRHSPRHSIRVAVDLVLSDGTLLPVESRSMSGSGMQVLCDTWVTDEIEPRGIQVHSVNHIKLKVVTSLPVNGENKKLYALCRIISARRLSQEEYILNLAFVEFENGTETVLDNYLAQFLQKKTVIRAIA